MAEKRTPRAADSKNPHSEIIKVLLIEDNEGDALIIQEMLAKATGASFDVECTDRLSTGLERLAEGGMDVVLLGLDLPDSRGLGTLTKARAQAPAVPMVVLTSLDDESLAIEALQKGAQEYLVKEDVNVSMLARVLRNSIERHRLRAELQADQARLRKIIIQNADGIIIVGRGGVVRFINPAAEALFGRTAEELLGELLGFPIVAGETTELDIIRRRGETAVAEMRVVATQWEGEPAYLASLRDISERVQDKAALREYSERLEEMVEERTKELRDAQEQLIRQEKLAVLGELAGGVAHELRNPLGAIKNVAYFLNMVLEEPDAEVKEVLEILEKEVGTCTKIISSLLDYARPKRPSRHRVDINEVVQQALSCVGVPENVEVVSDLDEALPMMVADPDQLGQVFGNIILNAIQAMTLPGRLGTPEGRRLVVRTWLVEGSEGIEKADVSFDSSVCSGSFPHVLVSISDTGVGIPERNLDKVFKPLFTTKAKGIGLGLALVKTLVEGHGGAIEVESAVGEGSTFTVKLPLKGSRSEEEP